MHPAVLFFHLLTSDPQSQYCSVTSLQYFLWAFAVQREQVCEKKKKKKENVWVLINLSKILEFCNFMCRKILKLICPKLFRKIHFDKIGCVVFVGFIVHCMVMEGASGKVASLLWDEVIYSQCFQANKKPDFKLRTQIFYFKILKYDNSKRFLFSS